MPDLAKQCASWHFNDGQGLDSKQAFELAQALEAATNDGTLGQYMALREEKLESLPKELCGFCNGNGVAIDYFATLSKKDNEQAQDTRTAEGQCRYCAGKGWTRSKPSLTFEEVEKWIAFLKDCGGFEIW